MAKKVKIADLEDNMHMLRFKTLSDKDLERLKKVSPALEYAVEIDLAWQSKF